MSAKQGSKQSPSRAAKRARFSESKGRSGGASPLILVAGLILALALIGGAVFALTGPDDSDEVTADSTGYLATSDGTLVQAATTGHSPYPLVEAEDGSVRFPLTTFDDHKAHHYTYMHEGQPIEFFLLKSKDGIVRAAFNACDVCFDSKKGYTQDGDYMVCNNCGRRFPADQINVVHGGCNPSPLTRVVEGDSLVIEVEEIVKGQDYF